MEHVANWVRFADTKGTILAASLGVVTTLLARRIGLVADEFEAASCCQRALVAVAASVALGSFVASVIYLVKTIAPRKGAVGRINRFAWPEIAKMDDAELTALLERQSVRDDAWAQVHALSTIAESKYTAFRRALWAFLLFVGGALVVVGWAEIARVL